MFNGSHLDRQRAVKCAGRLIIVVATLAAVPCGAQVSLGLSPMRVEIAMDPGSSWSGALRLNNEADDPVRVRTELLDFQLDSETTPQFADAIEAEKKFSCRDWLMVNPMETEVAPHTHLQVRFSVQIPADARVSSYHCGIGFTTMSAVRSIPIGLRAAVRVVSTLYVTVGNPPLEGQLAGLKLEPVRAGSMKSWRAVALISNPSRRYFRPTGELALLDESGRVLESVPFKPLPVLEERIQRFVFPLTTAEIRPGYHLRARVDLGTGDIQEGDVEVSPAIAELR
ncbi:MAG TPA: hypothetical protein VFA04_15465 [Bryobacteraceae bacterium]|nr:hypothetical protein [Bryobacteraceae bacterium]